MPDIKYTMDENRIEYALAKQTPSIEYIHTSYGDIDLDQELTQAVQEALERVLYKRINERPPVDIMVVELAPVQRDTLDEMVDLTGKSDDSLAQTIFDWGFEPMADMARMLSPKL